MKQLIILLLFLSAGIFTMAQEIIQIPHEKTNNVKWFGEEKTYFSKVWQTDVVTNISAPTMEVFRPKNPNGVSVIIAPGGGLYALSISSEGTDVAKWLTAKGITAFVLKYRLVPTAKDGVQELTDDWSIDLNRVVKRVEPVMPYAIADGLSALKYVRENATEFKIDQQKIGFMGFSAGGAVTMGVTYNYNDANRPNFIVPVYPWMDVMPVQKAPTDAPPMLVICASDDPLELAAGSIDLYSSWLKANKPVALQMYAKGGHGFGMKKQGLPSDHWIQRFYDWAIAQELISTTTE